MSKHDSLIRVARHLGYGDSAVSKILGALDDESPIDRVRAVADHTGMSELPTPLAASAADPRHAAIIKQTVGMLKHAARYDLPLGVPVDTHALDKALHAASIDTRLAIKENLHACGLIPA